jgi:hypothetical protein
MAVALRPAVILIALASLLFIVAGWLDQSGGAEVAAIESYAFGAVNLLVAVLIARGNERILALRIGLAAFFMFERPVTAVAFGEKPLGSIAVHLVTAIVEGVILVSTMRLWRLGHSVSQTDLAFLTLSSAATPATAAAGALAGGGAAPIAEAPAPSERAGRRGMRLPRVRAPRPRAGIAEGVAPLIAPRAGFAMGVLSLLLALSLIADGVAAGIVPGVTVDLASPQWLVYVFALVLLAVAARAVHGRRFAMRLLLVMALITFVERAFSAFALGVTDPVSLGLRYAAAFLALALAILSAAAIRSTRARRRLPLAAG